jgi:hypothetical protein
MKSKVLSVMATALMTGGMMFANTLGALPASTAGASPSGWASAADSTAVLPGVVSTQETPTVGVTTAGVRPGAGVQTGEMGSASPNSNALPGVIDASNTAIRTARNF